MLITAVCVTMPMKDVSNKLWNHLHLTARDYLSIFNTCKTHRLAWMNIFSNHYSQLK